MASAPTFAAPQATSYLTESYKMYNESVHNRSGGAQAEIYKSGASTPGGWSGGWGAAGQGGLMADGKTSFLSAVASGADALKKASPRAPEAEGWASK